MARAWMVQVASGDCPHMLFYGPPGAGKKTLIIALLRQIYGPGVEHLRVPPFSVPCMLHVLLTVLSSHQQDTGT